MDVWPFTAAQPIYQGPDSERQLTPAPSAAIICEQLLSWGGGGALQFLFLQSGGFWAGLTETDIYLQ